MLLTRWNRWQPTVWNQWNQLQNEMNRIFERFDAPRPEESAVPLNLWEQDDAYHLEAELPGVELGDIDITVTGPSQVTIKGERKPAEPKDGTAHRRERIFGSFVRTVTLPSVLDADKVEAKLENGVLKLTLPKHEAAKPRKITVKA